MNVLPSGAYGVLKGTLATPIEDPEDSTKPPVLQPAAGSVTITPSIRRASVTSEDAALVTLTPGPRRVELDDNGHFEVSLLATTSELVTPHGWTYKISFDLGEDASLAPFAFVLDAGVTTDLTSISTFEVSNGVIITKGDPGPRGPTGAPGVSASELAAQLLADRTRQNATFIAAPAQHGNPSKYAQWASYEYDAREFATDAAPLVKEDGSPGNLAPVWANFVSAMGSTFVRPRRMLLPHGTYDALMSAGTSSQPSSVAGRTAYSIPKPTKPLGLVGESRAGTIIRSDAYSAPFGGGSGPNQVSDVELGNLTIDCSAQSIAASQAVGGDGLYHAYYKAVFWSDIKRLYAHDLIVMNSGATSLGLDYLIDYLIQDVIIYNPGRFIRELGIDPASTSGGSGIGIGTGKYASEPGTISNAIVYNSGRNAFFWEGQPYVKRPDGTNYSPTSRGPVVGRNLVAINCWAGFQDCGLDGLDIELSAFDCTYGANLSETTLAPKAGTNGRARIVASGSKTADVYMDEMPDGKYRVEVLSHDGLGHGVISSTGANLGPQITLDLEVDNHAGAAAWIKPTSRPVTDLTIRGRARRNGQSTAFSRREAVVIEASTDGLRVDIDTRDTQAVPTQQAGVFLKGNGTATRASISGDGRGCVTPARIDQTVDGDTVFSFAGADLDQYSNLRVLSVNDGSVTIGVSEPVTGTLGVTDIDWQYRTAADAVSNTPAGAWTSFAHAASITPSRTFTGLTNGQRYQFRAGKVAGGVTSYGASIALAAPRPTDMYVYDGKGVTAASIAGLMTNGGTGSPKPITVIDNGTGGVIGVANGVKSTAGTGNVMAVVDCAVTGTSEADVAYLTTGASPFLGVVANVVDSQTYLLASARGFYSLTKRIAGASTTASTTVVPQVGDVYRIVRSATTAKLVVNGVVLATLTLSASDQTLFNGSIRYGHLYNYAVDPASKHFRWAYNPAAAA